VLRHMRDRIGFGIIGSGTIAWLHGKVISGLPCAQLIGVADAVPERAEKLRAEFGAREAYGDHSRLLAREDVDVVCVCTPSGLHAQIGVEAARAGKHVVTEKPIDVSLEKADWLIDTCRVEGVKLACIFQRRTSPLWQLVKRTVDEGRIGRMVLGSAYLKYSRTQDYYDASGWRGTWALDGGGALMNQGIHMVDILQWIMGPVSTVTAFWDHLVHRIEVDDTTCASLRFASGALGTIEATTSLAAGLDHRLEFHGQLGTIRVEGERIIEWSVPGQDVEWARSVASVSGDSMSPDPKSISPRGHEIQLADMAAAIRDNRDPMIGGAEARKSLELVLAIYESGRCGRSISLDNAPSADSADAAVGFDLRFAQMK